MQNVSNQTRFIFNQWSKKAIKLFIIKVVLSRWMQNLHKSCILIVKGENTEKKLHSFPFIARFDFTLRIKTKTENFKWIEGFRCKALVRVCFWDGRKNPALGGKNFYHLEKSSYLCLPRSIQLTGCQKLNSHNLTSLY